MLHRVKAWPSKQTDWKKLTGGRMIVSTVVMCVKDIVLIDIIDIDIDIIKAIVSILVRSHYEYRRTRSSQRKRRNNVYRKNEKLKTLA